MLEWHDFRRGVASTRHHSGAMPRRDEVRTSLRLPPELYAGIKEAAQTEQRSLNNLLERFLRDALDRWRAEHPTREGRPTPTHPHQP
jgi:hypothetical protein